MAEDSPSQQEDLDYLMEPPSDLHELYMRLRMSLSKSKSFYKMYMTLLSLIDVGGQLLPDGYDKEKEVIDETLEKDESYPQRRQVEKDGMNYRLGGDKTGLIVVRNEEIRHGLNEAIEQQTSLIIPKLKKIDNQIFRILVYEGTIKKKQPILEDLLIEQTIDELSKTVQEMQRQRSE